jgi:hypothetical protein
MYISIPSDKMSRRQLLRGVGVAMALPLLNAMVPVFGRAASPGLAKSPRPQRMIGVCNNLGLLSDRFFPTGTGLGYQLSPYLEHLAAHRDRFSVFSGVSHPGVDGSHSSDVSFLTAAPHPASGGFRNSISLDQFIAEKIGDQTRFPSLTLGVNPKSGRRSLSWTRSGVLIPCEGEASAVYRQLFLQGTASEVSEQMRKLELGQSIMDTVADQSLTLRHRLGSEDRARMDQYQTAVRDLETRMAKSREWARTPKPSTAHPPPIDPSSPSDYLEKTRLMYQMAHLAFETDSTRCITLLLDSNNSPTISVPGEKISDGYHNLSHHGKNPEKLAQLESIDQSHMRLLNEFLDLLGQSTDQGSPLLDHTLVMYGSNFGDANKHTTTNMPILLAGGHIRHGRHLVFDARQNYPLPNLFVSMLQSMGIESDRFASSTGSMTGLELRSLV